MPGDDGDAQLVELVLHFGDAGLRALGDATEVVVLELLAAGRRRTDERAVRHHQVGTHGEMLPVNQEILLLGA